MPKVSIIIPFNNVEDYIKQCLDSVLAQTLEDIEVILINDASVDKSRKIVQKYADKDKRIKIIDIQERKGQGFARNRAIEIATGDYIGFVDSDDFIEPNMFEELYKKAKSDDTDITMCQVREYDDINEYYISSDYYSLEPLISFGENVFSAEDTKEQILDINVALWNKIYKREYLIGLGEKFPEGFIYEDLPFFFGTYLPAKRINIVWQNLYSYRVNRKNSTMQQVNNKVLDRLPMVSLTYEKLKAVEYLSDLKKKIQGWIINDLFHRYTLLKENYHKEYFFLMKKVFENLEIENIEDDYWKKVYHFEAYLLVLNNSFEMFNQKVFNEYLDIYKIENRILSQITNVEELDRRFGLVYDDLSKVYKYSENIVANAKNELTKTLNVDEKISKVYEEITNNYEYTNKLKEEIEEKVEESINDILSQSRSETDEKISKVYEEITNNYEYTNKLKEEIEIKVEESINDISSQSRSETDEKISKVYEEITNNYEFTKGLYASVKEEFSESNESLKSELLQNKNLVNEISNDLKEQIKEKTKDLYNDIKDLSFVSHDNFVELSKEQEKIKEEYRKLIVDVSMLQDEKTNEKISSINDRLEQIASSIENQKNQNIVAISELLKRIEEERKQTYELISNMKSEFVDILREEQIKHKEEVLEFKHQIKELEYDLRAELKSPFRKMVEKYNKQGK